MSKKLFVKLASVSGVLSAGVLALAAHAQDYTAVVVPTSTQASISSVVGTQLSDPGTLLILILAAGVPFAFWFISRLIGLLPKGRGHKRD